MNTNQNGFINCGAVECECMGKGHRTTRRIVAERVSAYEPDMQCEHGDANTCERQAAAWTMPKGSGYVVACATHAQECLDAAVEAGDIYELTEQA